MATVGFEFSGPQWIDVRKPPIGDRRLGWDYPGDKLPLLVGTRNAFEQPQGFGAAAVDQQQRQAYQRAALDFVQLVESNDPRTDYAVFAAKYGGLGVAAEYEYQQAPGGRVREVRGEPVTVWTEDVRHAWGVFEQLTVAQALTAERDLLRDPTWKIFTSKAITRRQNKTEGWNRSHRAVRDEMTKKIAHMVSEKLRDVGPIFQLAGNRLPLTLEPMIPSLRALIWFQLAKVASDGGTLRRCAECPNVMLWTGDRVVGPQSNAVYCSNRCRQRAYRVRKAATRSSSSDAEE
jgi:hypothetical protein